MSEKENDSLLGHERQKQLNRGITVARGYTFVMSPGVRYGKIFYGVVKAIYNGWVVLGDEQETTINLDYVAVFFRGSIDDEDWEKILQEEQGI